MSRRLFIIIFIVVLCIGIGTKLYYAYNLKEYLDGDPASIGLIAQDLLQGRFNIFFYGQNFNGPLEAFWLSPFIWLFGLKAFVLFLGMISIYVIFLLTMYKLGFLIKDEYTGLLALSYCAVSTYPLLHNSVFPYGYHMSVLVFGNLLLIFALKEKNILSWFLMGLTAGLGFWNHFIIMYYLVPVAIFLLCLPPRPITGYITAFISFFIGSLPFWVHNLKTNFSSFNMRGSRPYGYYPTDIPLGEVIRNFFGYHLSAILGIQKLDLFGYIVWGIFIISLAVFFIRFNRKKFLFLLLLVSIVGFSFSQKFFVISPKYCYFLPLYTVIGIFIAYLINKIRFAGVILLLFLLSFNMTNLVISTSEGRYGKEDKDLYNKKSGLYKGLIQFLYLNRINGVITDFETAQGLNFMTDKRIAGAELLNGRPPTDEIVQGRDNLAILDCIDFLESSLNIICNSYRTAQCGRYNIAYNFKRHTYNGRSIPSSGWKAVTNYNSMDAKYSFDRNLDRFWSGKKDKQPGIYYELDLGRLYEIYKLAVFNINPHLNNFPAGYMIKVSEDGINWKRIIVGKDAQPLFWSGPRIYWDYYNGRWEVIFHPVSARFIRIEQTDFGKWQWMINEVFVYEYTGQEDYKEKSREICEFLLEEGIKFVYADFWLSAKIREISNGRIGTLRVMNECYPERKDTSRLMKLDRGTAVVISKSEEDELERLMKEFNLPIDKKYFGNYTCYLFRDFMDFHGYLYWLGFSAAKININIYNQLKAGKDVKKHLHRPRIEKNIEFKNGITFLGISIFRFKEKLMIKYFWKLPKKIPKDIVVFVHFTKDGKITFQGDHPFLETYQKPIIPHKDLVYVEKYWVKIPLGTETNTYRVSLGLYSPRRRGKRIKTEDGATKVDVGWINKDNRYFPSEKNGLKGRVIFTSDEKGIKEVYIMDADGANRKRLTATGKDSGYANFSPDGKSIVFSSNRDGNNNIYIMKNNGAKQRRLTDDPADDINPSWHPDGKRIIFVSNRDGATNFYLTNKDGSSLTKITDFKDGVHDMPRISPDGKEIIFTSNMSMGWQLFKIGIDGRKPERITDILSGHCEGVWSHKGDKIMYVSRFADFDSDIYIMDRNGRNEQKLAVHEGLDYNPRFSPDDRKIIFSSERDGNWELYTMDIETKKQIRLTNTDSNEEWPDWGTTD